MACCGAIKPFSVGVIASLTRRRPAADVIDSPGTSVCIVFEGDGRGRFDLTDRDPGQLKAGMPLEMTFRKVYFDRLTTVCNTMAARTTEVARNAIAIMRFGLPKEPKK